MPIHRSASAFARGAIGGLRTISMSRLVNTASNPVVNLVSRSRIRNRKVSRPLVQFEQDVAGLLGHPLTARMPGDAQDVVPARPGGDDACA